MKTIFNWVKIKYKVYTFHPQVHHQIRSDKSPSGRMSANTIHFSLVNSGDSNSSGPSFLAILNSFDNSWLKLEQIITQHFNFILMRLFYFKILNNSVEAFCKNSDHLSMDVSIFLTSSKLSSSQGQ